MTEYEKRINRAMSEVKKAYGHECIFSGHHEDTIIGAHIFKRSTYPHMAAWPENIVPLSPQNDLLLEAVKDPWKRICVILNSVDWSNEPRVVLQMKKLIQLVMSIESKAHGFIS